MERAGYVDELSRIEYIRRIIETEFAPPNERSVPGYRSIAVGLATALKSLEDEWGEIGFTLIKAADLFTEKCNMNIVEDTIKAVEDVRGPQDEILKKFLRETWQENQILKAKLSGKFTVSS